MKEKQQKSSLVGRRKVKKIKSKVRTFMKGLKSLSSALTSVPLFFTPFPYTFFLFLYTVPQQKLTCWKAIRKVELKQ